MIAAIYSRKSKFTGVGESIDNQIEMCKEYARTHLENITDFFIYEDEGFSGGNTNRPEFQKLINDAKNNKFNILICYRLDRISRNVADFSGTLETLQRHNIDFISIKEQFDTTTPMGRAMIYIASVFAQLERETIAERIRDNMTELAKTGRWLGGVAPLGFKAEQMKYLNEDMKERKLMKLVPVIDELELVKTLYKKYLELKSLSAVETWTLQNNITTKRGCNFNKSNLRTILTNPVYVKANEKVIHYLERLGITVCGKVNNNSGLLTYNKQKTIYGDSGEVKRLFRDKNEWIAAISKHDGIIEPDAWLKVQEIRKENKDKFPNADKSHTALFSGKLRCAKCGSKMQVTHGHISKITGEKLCYYRCTLKHWSKNVKCDCKNASALEIDSTVKEALKNFSKNKESLLKQLSKNNKKTSENINFKDKKITLNNKIKENENKIDKLLDKFAIDESIQDLLLKKIKTLKEENDKIKEKINSLASDELKENENELNLDLIKILLNKCSMIDTLNNDEIKEISNALIEDILWNGDTGDLTINFIGSGESKKKQ
ncbi:MAG: recombinase family protein [Clostridium sp.]